MRSRSPTSKPGKVYLVGAGPGHPDLLTLKGHDLIRNAEIIIYDRLIQEEVLSVARADAEKIYVGKKPSLHGSRQAEINRLLGESARRVSLVVRLKGGDPVLFGRGGEEAEYLASQGIPFEVVPGVTAGLSVPMAAGIPVTHRDYSANVALVTGHRRDDKDTKEVDWGALAKLDTLVFFMSVGKLPEIAQKLIAHGCDPDTDAAIIQMAYWPGEEVVVGTLGTLPQLAEEAGIKPPATIVIGKVVRVRERLTTLHRDLRRDQDEPVGFGLSAKGLLSKLGSILHSAEDLRVALELNIFDELESSTLPEELARAKGWVLEPLQELLVSLASLGLLVRNQRAFQNTEATSQYLNTRSDLYLGSQLQHMVEESASYHPLDRIPSQRS